MAATQILNYRPDALPYAFLSKPPPPPQKARPTHPPPPVPILPRRRRSSTFSTIAAWAAHVQPGSPPPRSPHSPRRRPSLTRRPSISRRPEVSARRPSISSIRSALPTPCTTPSTKDLAFDLTDLGYTSVFLHLPITPSTPSPYLQAHHRAHMTTNAEPAPVRSLQRFRSLSILRPRNRSATKLPPPSPTKSLAAKPKSKNPTASASTVTKRKKSLYPASSKHTRAPPTLANELALMQFADGGSVDNHVKRLMEAQARAAAGSRAPADGVLSIGDVYRDGNGGIWWDREEEMEYAHLLGGVAADGDEEMRWVSFGDDDKENSATPLHNQDEPDAALALASLAGLERRGSSSSTQTQDSDMDPRNVVQPAEEDAALLHMTVPRLISAAPPPAKTQIRARRPAPILTHPSRPHAAFAHLRKTSHFLLDLAAFVPPSPASPSNTRTPLPPRTPRSPTHKRTSPMRSAFALGNATRLRGKARRRPAPLKLSVSASATSAVPGLVLADAAAADAGAADRREFMDASFAPPSPAPPAAAPPRPAAAASKSKLLAGSGGSLGVPGGARGAGMKKKPSRLELRFGALFGRRE